MTDRLIFDSEPLIIFFTNSLAFFKTKCFLSSKGHYKKTCVRDLNMLDKKLYIQQ